MLSLDPLGLDSALLDEGRAYLRIDDVCDDASLGAILLAAIGHAENITGQILLQRQATQRQPVTQHWQRLSASPVVVINSVTGIPAEGAAFPLASDAWRGNIEANGNGWVRVYQPGAAGRIDVRFTVGLAADWGALPEPLRLAILRLAGHLFNNRDGGEDVAVPSTVTALLHPYRKVRLA